MQKKALIVQGGWDGHDPVRVSEIFKGVLEAEGFFVTVSDTLDVLKDREMLFQTDLFVPEWTDGKIEGACVKNVDLAARAGMGIAGCHGGMCDSFRENTDWQFITGAQWVAHPGNDGINYRVDIRHGAASPIIEGMNDFDVCSEQYYMHVDPAAQVLATTRFPVADGPYAANGAVDIPVVFTKRWGEGRIFYSSLGHTSAVFKIPEALELMRRGFLWASR